MNDQDRLRFERRGRELTMLYGSPSDIAGMISRQGAPFERQETNPDHAEAFRMKRLGLTFREIARRLGYHANSVSRWFA